MNILIIGTVGSGKSSIGLTLATMLKMKIVELDELVLEQTGYLSIEEVYKERYSLWKECELEVSKDVSLEDNTVFICGGGFVENELNILYFKEHSKKLCIFYIHSKPDTIIKRISAIKNYDFKNKNRVKNLYKKRDVLSRLYADYVVENENKEIVEVALEICDILKQNKKSN